MHKNATKCNETLNKWCKNKHGASKIMDTLETYQDAPANEAGNNVLRRQAGITQLILNPVEGIDWPHHVLGVIGLVLHLNRWLVHIWQQIQQVNCSGVLHIEEALLPLLA
jgi:hypothetical protein